MLKILCAIMTAHKLDYFINDLTVDFNTAKNNRETDPVARRQAIRDTYLKELVEVPNVDYKFFFGKTPRPARAQRNKYANPEQNAALREPLADEVFLDCPDFYFENSRKMKAIIRWAQAHEYDYLLRLDDDSYFWPERLEEYLPQIEGNDYVGASTDSKAKFHPGGCLFLSAHAMRLVEGSNLGNWADDCWIGDVMRKHGVPLTGLITEDGRDAIQMAWGNEYVVDETLNTAGLLAAHSCRPAIMRAYYERDYKAEE
jgi:hypothetical protein